MKNSKKIISAILVVILVLGALVFTACGPAKKNLLKTMAPDDLLKYVYMTDAEEFASKFVSVYDKYLTNYGTAVSSKSSMSYEPSDEIISFLEDDMMGGFKLGLDKLGADLELQKKSPTDFAYLIDLTVNGASVLDLDMYSADNTMVIASDALFGGAYKNEAAAGSSTVTDISFLPTSEVVKTLLPKIVEIAITEVKGVTVTEEQAVNFGDVYEQAVALDADITDATLTKIADAVLSEIKDNQDIKKILTDFYNTAGKANGLDYEFDSAEEFYRAYVEAISDAIETVKEDAPAEGEEEVVCTFRTWIDDDYHIIAVNLKNDDGELLIGASEDDDDKGYIFDLKNEGTPVFSLAGSVIKEKNDTSVSFTLVTASSDFSVNENGELVEGSKNTSISLKGSSTVEKKIMSGNYTLSVDGKDYLKAELTDIDGKAYAKDNRFVGTVKLSTLSALNDLLSEADLEPIVCTIVAEDTKDVNKVSTVIDLTHGDMPLGKFYITAEMGEDVSEFTVPEASDEMPEPDLTALFENLKKAGINENLIAMLEMSMSGDFGDDYYGDEYYDDEYFGDDYFYAEDYEDIFSDM